MSTRLRSPSRGVESLDPATMGDTGDLRRAAEAVASVTAAEGAVRSAVMAARTNGRSWGRIALAMGSSRQAAQQRFGDVGHG